jgi:uncharacterized protein (TIGR03437 family)
MTTKKNKNNLINRRESLRLLGAAGAAALVAGGSKNVIWLWPARLSAPAQAAGIFPNLQGANLHGVINPALFASTPLPMVRRAETLACVARPALTEGPYFVDEKLNRSDIRTDPSTNAVSAGVPLKLKFTVNNVSGSACSPVAGAWVDIWHCDAAGAYSDIANGAGQANTSGKKYLRGYQVTDARGAVEFTTVYPGWYSGRSVHIHYKVRLFSGSTKTYEFTSQVFFDDTLTDQVFTQAPYNSRGTRNTRNSNDGIYQSGGTSTLLSVTSDGAGGYTSTYDIGVTGVPNTVATVSTVSAATFASGGAVAAEGIAALFGSGLASSTFSATTSTLPTSLGGVQVQVKDSAGVTRNAPLFFVSPTQINFQVPAGIGAGSATVSVLLNGSTVGTGAVAVAAVAPGLFTANSTGKGVPAAVVLRLKADGTQSYEALSQYDSSQNAFVATPIDLGASTDQLFLVGFGTGLRNRTALSGVIATVGGTNANVSFAGAQGSYAGLDQVNISIPKSLAGRGSVDVALSVDGNAANTVTINVK